MEEEKVEEAKVEYVDDYTLDSTKYIYVDGYKIPVYKMQDNTKEVENEIIQYDMDFDSSKFFTVAKRMFLDILNAKTQRETTLLKVIESPNLYVQHEREIAEDVQGKKRHIYEDPSIKYVALKEVSIDGEKEILSVWLSVAVQEYFENETTHELLTEKYPVPPLYNYRINFIRNKGTKTNLASIKCNNCNATVDLEMSAKCQYCGTLIDSSKYNWVINTIEIVKEINTKLTNIITEEDPLFSEEKFVAFVNKTFIKVQDAYSNIKLEDIYPFVTEALLEKLNKEIELNKGYGNVETREHIEIQDTYIQDMSIDSEYEKVTVYLEALLLAYAKDIEYNVVSSGTDKITVVRKYNLELLRKAGLKTSADKDIATINCIHCGAPFNLDEHQRCAYCGAQADTDETGKTDWLLNDMLDIVEKENDNEWKEYIEKKEANFEDSIKDKRDNGFLNSVGYRRGIFF